MFYSTTDLQYYTYSDGASNFSNSPNVTLGDFFTDCIKQDLKNISLVGNSDDVEPFWTFFSNLFQCLSCIADNGFNVSTYANQEDLFEVFKNNVNNTYCFGIDIAQFDTLHDVYNFSLIFPQSSMPKSS